MQLARRNIVDKSFSIAGVLSVLFMVAVLALLMGPIAYRGAGAFAFRGTIEHRRFVLEHFERGNRERVLAEIDEARAARKPVYEMIAKFREETASMSASDRRRYQRALADLEERLGELLGPNPTEGEKVLVRQRYGQTRWDRAMVKLHGVLYIEQYDYSDPTQMGRKINVPRETEFAGTSLEPLFGYIEGHLSDMLKPRFVFYWRFLFDKPVDAHMFGGIWPEVLGTVYLSFGAMLFAVPMGVIAAIYLAEYAGEGRVVGLLRVFISTLAGVPSIVFGLFGLAFFINTVHVSQSKSVLAGALTLALLVLPTVIRASEEAIRAVPNTYREAALALGASKWRGTLTVVLPAALPGILTGIVISMGRAAGETAPIIFTAAVSVGNPLGLLDTLTQATPALPWNIYNLCTEHEAVDEIRHVQFGMVLALIAIVLLFNATAIIIRARITKAMKG